MTNEELTMAILKSAEAIKKDIQPNELLDYITNLQEENERLKLHIMAIKEAISTWDLEYTEGEVDFKIPKKIKNIVWGDK